MDLESKIEAMTANAPGFIGLLGGRLVDLNEERRICTFEFNPGVQFCHSGDVVQGGFTTAMLDAAMSHAVFGTETDVVNLSSLEIKTSYLGVTRAGTLRAEGEVIKITYKTAFLEARLYNADNELTATASSVAKVIRAK